VEGPRGLEQLLSLGVGERVVHEDHSDTLAPFLGTGETAKRVLRGELAADPEVTSEAALKLGLHAVELLRVDVHSEQQRPRPAAHGHVGDPAHGASVDDRPDLGYGLREGRIVKPTREMGHTP
jgi:hypothetical protein